MSEIAIEAHRAPWKCDTPPPWRLAFREAAVVVVACAMVASTLNAVRADGIPFLQREDYAILVPCPETSGQVESIDPRSAPKNSPRVLWVDARVKGEFHEWHPEGAVNMVFDYLTPVDRPAIGLIISSGAKEVIVYGDGQDPDSGEQLALELAGKGIRNIRYMVGGAPALRRAQEGGDRR